MFGSSTSKYAANIKLVQDLYAAFTRRDMQAVLSALAEDVVWQEPPNPFNPAAGTRRGHAGFLEWARVGHESEDIVKLDVHNFLAGPDMVAAVGSTTCRAKTTGRVYETDFVHVVTVKAGKVARFQEFFDTYAAAEAFRP
jgi:uncharacterized protein